MKKQKNTSEIYELNIRMYKIMRTPEQSAARLHEIDLMIEKAETLELGEEAIEALIDSKEELEGGYLNIRQERELYQSICNAELDKCGIHVYGGGFSASTMVMNTEVFEGVKEKFEAVLRESSHLARFEGYFDVRGDDAEDSFLLKVDGLEVTMEAGRGAREDD